jgi:hypothetical protein
MKGTLDPKAVIEWGVASARYDVKSALGQSRRFGRTTATSGLSR